jgi:hypothetical protein
MSSPFWLIPFRSSRLSFRLNSPTIRTKRYLPEQKLIYPKG